MISQLGRYNIIGELGQGAMGTVYKAVDPLIDRIVAIKTINLSLAMDEKDEYESRFYQEAKAAGRLSHPNIVTIYDVGKSGEIAYIAMEFLQGRELRDLLNDGKRMPIEQVINIVAQVAQGLAYAHENGIVHRDVKPSNIMIVREGHVKITDFGIARMASAAVRTQTGMVLGSPKYMSPEQVVGKQTDQRSDIFSLGVMLYEMLTGQAPFAGENVNAIMYQTLNSVPPPPSSLSPNVPEMLNFIVAKALAKKLEHRYQNAKEFAGDLYACRDRLPRPSIARETVKPAFPTSSQMADTIPAAKHVDTSEDESKPVATLGLSAAFDSAAATLRLAALTGTAEEVEEFSKTFKMPIPSVDELNRAAPVSSVLAASVSAKPKIDPPLFSKPRAAPAAASYPGKQTEKDDSGSFNWLLIGGGILLVLGLISMFIFK
ncbi:MAG: serine/threonine protein kinase [Gallionellales bacterium 35-53-114]|jgi:serine/threonine-protein kinase|nr:MAG: serine/threonine protein kinase [Gallionellales bacterium 35-53-114]OYZ63181.1 MAG: serine/threonine protein kinase [Gallionellales bacterium 24-53-125]OZB08648.1 MAG: serine/threonine protein kinase [Gallionellales bacterium 39-52-133]HQS57497.1 serine/threonine-protein kinase [Gallionellaceae bacterium]HQS74315.1 serine/threonine-protein kinase [Gallionellaceae bacterium]